MSWTDGVLLLLLAAFAAAGAMVGLVRQLAALAGFVLGLALALVLYRPVASLIAPFWATDPQATAFLLIFLGVWILANLLAFGTRPRATDERRDADRFDAIAGALFGLLSGVCMLAVLVAGVVWLGLPVAEAVARSSLGLWLLNVAAFLAGFLPSGIPWPRTL
ncbi:MAG: CvpA family protein [Chloroflexi bacterium]|nr:CvpA family protein [Chloroflexota bacterium]